MQEENNKDDKKYVVIGGSGSITASMIAQFKKEFGEDIIILTSEEAREQGLLTPTNDLSKTKVRLTEIFPITNPYQMQPEPIILNQHNPFYGEIGKKTGKGKRKRW